MESKWLRARESRQGSARQLYLSRLIRSMLEQLSITQPQLGSYLGVSEVTVRRWARKSGTFPIPQRWMRIREVWGLVKTVRDKGGKFWEDRIEPPDFSC